MIWVGYTILAILGIGVCGAIHGAYVKLGIPFRTWSYDKIRARMEYLQAHGKAYGEHDYEWHGLDNEIGRRVSMENKLKATNEWSKYE